MIRKFHPDKVPILLNRVKQSKLKEFDNNKYTSAHQESLSSKASQSSSSSWSSRRNCSSTIHRQFTSSPTTHFYTQNRPSKRSTKSTLGRISFYTQAIASIQLSEGSNDHMRCAFEGHLKSVYGSYVRVINTWINQYLILPLTPDSDYPGAKMYLFSTLLPF